jgi:hypothetical protein
VRFSGKFISTRHFTPGHLKGSFATQHLFVKLEGGLALAVETEIWIDLHVVFLVTRDYAPEARLKTVFLPI